MWKGGGVGCWNAGDSHNNIMAMAIRIINTWWYPKNGTKPVNQCVSRVGPIVVLITTMVVTYASTLLEIFLSPCWLNVMCVSLQNPKRRPSLITTPVLPWSDGVALTTRTAALWKKEERKAGKVTAQSVYGWRWSSSWNSGNERAECSSIHFTTERQSLECRSIRGRLVPFVVTLVQEKTYKRPSFSLPSSFRRYSFVQIVRSSQRLLCSTSRFSVSVRSTR